MKIVESFHKWQTVDIVFSVGKIWGVGGALYCHVIIFWGRSILTCLYHEMVEGYMVLHLFVWDSVIVLCFVMHYFVAILVLRSS